MAMVITQDMQFEPGMHFLAEGIVIDADNITVDGTGATLIGKTGQGVGITVNGRHHVTLKNFNIQGYFHGIYAQDSTHLTVERCTVRGTAEIPANTIFLNIWQPARAAYGGGLFLWRVRESKIHENDLQHQMNGLLAYQCQQLQVEANNASYCSGFGFYLNRTTQSTYRDNFADYCCRYHPRAGGSGHMGADAAGFVIVNGSSHNQFLRNKARLGGDGFFLAGLTPQGEHVGCNENLFVENDGSYSPNIAFEATFSMGNIYRDNRANYCNYGFWLGFSRGFTLENNKIWRNRQAGIAVENGIEMQVQANDFRANGHGILLWSKYVQKFANSVPENDTSRLWQICDNRFDENQKGIRIAAAQDHGIRPLITEPLPPAPHGHVIMGNRFENGRIAIELEKVAETVIENNEFANIVEDEIRIK